VCDAGDATFRGTFRKVTRTSCGRFADVLQVSHRALRTYHTHFTAFRGVSQTFRASVMPAVTHVSRTIRGVSRTFRRRFASVALDASMQPRCHNVHVGISTQHDGIKILNLKHSVTVQLSEPERPNLLLL
jgi:hypothetical protein